MRKYFLATVSVLTLNCGAQAADMPVKAPARPAVAPVNWAGWYVGLQGGMVDHDGKFYDSNGFLTGAFGDPAEKYTASNLGAMFGGHVGYNIQRDRLVFGLEADFSGIWAKADATAPSPPAEPGSPLSFDVKWLATVRGRAGTTITDTTLLYLTGGVAFGRVENSVTLGGGIGGSPSMVSDETKIGWTIGGGIEHMVAPNWTLRAEARYVDLGKSSADCSPATNGSCINFPYRGEFSNTLLMGLVGLSLRF
jgi:outer membrane immunogenic protein